MELFTTAGKLKKFFLTTRDVRRVRHGWHGTHRYDIQVLATHASAWVRRYSSLLQWSVPKSSSEEVKCMRRIMLSFVARLAVPCFSTLSHKRHDFRKKVIERKMCVLTFCTNFVWNVSHSKKNSARCHKCKYVFMHITCYSSQISMKLELSRLVFQKYSNCMKLPLLGAEFFRADGQTDRDTDMTKLIAILRKI
jgi:hypothetical protein